MSKKATKTPEELQAALQELIAQGRKEGMVRTTDLNAILEKMDLSADTVLYCFCIRQTTGLIAVCHRISRYLLAISLMSTPFRYRHRRWNICHMVNRGNRPR